MPRACGRKDSRLLQRGVWAGAVGVAWTRGAAREFEQRLELFDLELINLGLHITMSTRILHDKIPHNQRVPRNKGKAARDAVTPSVRGIALRKIVGSGRITDAVRKATKIAVGLDALLTARKLAAATGDAELAELANDPKIMKAVDRAIKRLGRDVDLFLNRPNEGDPHAAAGLIGDARGTWHQFDPETMRQREIADAKTASLRSTMALDTEQNKVRAQFGLDPVPLKGDDLYKVFGKEGKRSDA